MRKSTSVRTTSKTTSRTTFRDVLKDVLKDVDLQDAILGRPRRSLDAISRRPDAISIYIYIYIYIALFQRFSGENVGERLKTADFS